MQIMMVGLNYRTAPVEVRERFSFAEQDLPVALRDLVGASFVKEGMIVNTCNRTEIYTITDHPHGCGSFIRGFLEKWFDVSRAEFNAHLYTKQEQVAIEHLFRVTCGLDSMILGETQILGQVRDSFLLAQKENVTGIFFNKLFKLAVTLAKRAHAETKISQNAISVSYAAVELAKQELGNLHDRQALVIGAGKMGELTAKHLYDHGLKNMKVVNRTRSKAAQLANQLGAVGLSMDELEEALLEADIVISSTGSNRSVLTKAQMVRVLDKRKPTANPLLLIDIAVPRDFDPAIADLDNVRMYDIDNLDGVIQHNLEQRNKEAEKVEGLIAEEIVHFRKWYQSLGVGPVIHALQEKTADIHEETMQSLLNKLPDLSQREIKVIRKLSKSIANQLLQDPIMRIKEMAAEKDGEGVLELFTQLFGLEDQIKPSAFRERDESNKLIPMPRKEKENSIHQHERTSGEVKPTVASR